MDSLVIMVEPFSMGRTFNVILARLHNPSADKTHFELTIVARHTGVQGDMVQERLEDVVNPFFRVLAGDLDRKLKQLRKQV